MMTICKSLFFLILSQLIITSPQKISEAKLNHTFNTDKYINITLDANNTKLYDKISYYKEFVIPSHKIQEIRLDLQNRSKDFGYMVLQAHSYAYNLTFSYHKTSKEKFYQHGTNIGFTLFKGGNFSLHNTNQNMNVTYVLIGIIYGKDNPVAGGCNLEGNVPESPVLILTPIKEMIQIDTPSAALSISQDVNQKLCSNTSQLNYQGIYHFLPKRDFSKETYFNGIKKMIEAKRSKLLSDFANKKPPSGPANRRIYIQVPGTGIVFNTIVESLDGQVASYIPTVTYSCSPWFWESGCTIIPDEAGFKVFSGILIIIGIMKTFIFFGEPYVPLFVNCIPIGAYIAYRGLVYCDISPGFRIACLIISGLAFAICMLVLGITLVPIAYIFSITSNILFTWIFTYNTFYLFDGYSFATNDTLYYVIFFFFFFTCLLSFCWVFRLIWLVINVIIGVYSLLIGVQILMKSNMLFIPLNHFYRIEIEGYSYGNGLPNPSKIDICIIIGAVGLMFLGIICKRHKVFVYGKRPHTEPPSNADEGPLISRWTHGSDEVFESPNTNYNFFRRLSESPMWG